MHNHKTETNFKFWCKLQLNYTSPYTITSRQVLHDLLFWRRRIRLRARKPDAKNVRFYPSVWWIKPMFFRWSEDGCGCGPPEMESSTILRSIDSWLPLVLPWATPVPNSSFFFLSSLSCSDQETPAQQKLKPMEYRFVRLFCFFFSFLHQEI